MRILLMHPNYHSGGAEIAGNWPPAWVAYLTGYLKAGGFSDVVFVDAMTDHLTDEQVRQRIEDVCPDVIGCTAITPAIYKAERLLQIAKEVNPDVVTVLGGIHGTFMYRQVLAEAPYIDAIVRGEGEEIMVEVAKAVAEGRWPEARDHLRRALERDERDGSLWERLAHAMVKAGDTAGLANLEERYRRRAGRKLAARW